jgi:hypothetical protein
MHDSLGKFLEENKAAFDSHVPSPELWDRIAAQSPEIKKATKKQTMFVFGRIAAAAVVVLVLAFGWQLYFAKSPVTDEFAAQYAPLDEEVKEAAMYYEVEIERKSQQVFELTSNQPAIREGVEMDMAELDEVLNQLKNDLKDNVSNAEVLAAMIQNYRLKLDILEQILEYVEQKDDNTNENIVIHEL